MGAPVPVAAASVCGAAAAAFRYDRRRPERTALYELVRDNLDSLLGAITDGALDVKLGVHELAELEAFLDCGLLCRGLAATHYVLSSS